MTNVELIEKANKELARVRNYIEEHRDMFDMMDLKLHRVSYYDCSRTMEKEFPLCCEYSRNNAYGFLFELFCDSSYEEFIEFCNENCIDFQELRHSVGRTSKFYLHPWHDCGRFDVCQMLDDIEYWGFCTDFKIEDFTIVPTEEQLDGLNEGEREDLEVLIDRFYNDFIEYINDMKLVYDYIKNFKTYQLEYYKEYLRAKEEDFLKEARERDAYESDCLKKCVSIRDKYSISKEDMETLKNCIQYY